MIRMYCNAVQPVSAVSKSMREFVVVGVAVATRHLQLCLMHQRPEKTAHQAQDVRAVMSSKVFALLH